MRELLHVIAMALVVTVAAVCTLIQVSDASHAIHRLSTDEQSVIQPVDSTTSGR